MNTPIKKGFPAIGWRVYREGTSKLFWMLLLGCERSRLQDRNVFDLVDPKVLDRLIQGAQQFRPSSELWLRDLLLTTSIDNVAHFLRTWMKGRYGLHKLQERRGLFPPYVRNAGRDLSKLRDVFQRSHEKLCMNGLSYIHAGRNEEDKRQRTNLFNIALEAHQKLRELCDVAYSDDMPTMGLQFVRLYRHTESDPSRLRTILYETTCRPEWSGKRGWAA